MRQQPAVMDDQQEEIATLVRTLHETQQRLQALTGGEIDAVVHSGGQSYLLHDAQEKLQRSEMAQRDFAAIQSSTLNALPAHIALLDHAGTILSVNEGWQHFARSNGLEITSSCVGENYLEVCEHARGEFSDEALAAASGIRAVIGGVDATFSLDYPCHSPTEQRWFRLRVNPLENGGPRGAVVMHLDITATKLTEFRLQRLNRLHAVLSKTSEVCVRRRDRQKLFEAVCRIVVEDGRLRMALIFEMDADSREVQATAARGEGKEQLRELKITTDGGPLSLGTVGTALRTGRYNVCNNIPHDLRMEPWREIAAQQGVVATAAFPLTLEGITFGALVLHASEVGYFEDDEIRLMVAVASHLSFALTAQQKERQRQQATRALEQQTTELRALFDLVPAMIWFKDTHNGFLRVNQRVAETTGLRIEEIEGQSAYDIFPEQAVGYYKDDLEVIQSGLPKMGIVEQLPGPQGEKRWVQSDKVPVLDAEGTVTGLVALVHDITERKKAEQEIRFNEQRFRSLVEATASIAWDMPASGEFEVEQPGWSAFTGQSFEELRGWGWLQAIHPEDREETERVWSAAVANRTLYVVEHRILTCDQKYRNMAARAVPILNEEGNIRQWFGIHADITELKKLEQQFFRAQRLESIGTLAGGIAHDLNNVLAPIVMSVDLLKLEEKDARRLSILTMIEGSAKRGADMVRQMLLFGRGVEGRRVKVAVQQLVSEVEKIANDTFLKHFRVQTRVAPDLWTVLGDPTQLYQVLLNLAVNARDAMPDGGTLTISAENLVIDPHHAALNPEAQPGPYITLQVEDTGTGMEPEVIEQIFDPFFTTKELGKGTGLGLSTSLAIVKSHGGFVRVESELGRGTKFRISLPAQTKQAAADTEFEESAPQRGAGELILVVDDEASVRQITQRTLEAFGYRVILASDGAEAVATYARQGAEIAVVLTDMMMPVMDGPETIIGLRKLNAKLPIIAASGLPASDHVAQFASLGVQHFLPKPYTAETMLKVLRQILGKP